MKIIKYREIRGGSLRGGRPRRPDAEALPHERRLLVSQCLEFYVKQYRVSVQPHTSESQPRTSESVSSIFAVTSSGQEIELQRYVRLSSAHRGLDILTNKVVNPDTLIIDIDDLKD